MFESSKFANDSPDDYVLSFITQENPQKNCKKADGGDHKGTLAKTKVMGNMGNSCVDPEQRGNQTRLLSRPRLPPELHNLIFEKLAKNKSVLRNLLVASKEFHAVATPIFHHHIAIDSTNLGRLCAIWSDKPELPKVVKSLTIRDGQKQLARWCEESDVFQTNLCDIIAAVKPTLQELRLALGITSSNLSALTAYVAILDQSFPRLISFSWVPPDTTTSTLAQFLNNHNSLEAVRIRFPFSDSGAVNPDPISLNLPNLKVFEGSLVQLASLGIIANNLVGLRLHLESAWDENMVDNIKHARNLAKLDIMVDADDEAFNILAMVSTFSLPLRVLRVTQNLRLRRSMFNEHAMHHFLKAMPLLESLILDSPEPWNIYYIHDGFGRTYDDTIGRKTISNDVPSMWSESDDVIIARVVSTSKSILTTMQINDHVWALGTQIPKGRKMEGERIAKGYWIRRIIDVGEFPSNN
ncbi:hypothetical protein FB451DRAFT_1184875 [Mycena latifolia]|nr:hypothetical protein FB451DRAFT_1184875 [Mycena latifolia]